jgi:hypothetical protein
VSRIKVCHVWLARWFQSDEQVSTIVPAFHVSSDMSSREPEFCSVLVIFSAACQSAGLQYHAVRPLQALTLAMHVVAFHHVMCRAQAAVEPWWYVASWHSSWLISASTKIMQTNLLRRNRRCWFRLRTLTAVVYMSGHCTRYIYHCGSDQTFQMRGGGRYAWLRQN